jgi:hypothetical protein
MKSSGTGRVLATLFLGVMSGIYIHFTEMRAIERGRDVFLAAQSHRFDRLTQYHSAVNMVIAGVILAVIAVGLYELIAAGFTKLAGPSTAEE